MSNKYGKQSLDTATNRASCCKNWSRKSTPYEAQVTGFLIRKKIGEKVVIPKPITDENSRNVEEIVIPAIKR